MKAKQPFPQVSQNEAFFGAEERKITISASAALKQFSSEGSSQPNQCSLRISSEHMLYDLESRNKRG